MISGAEGHPLGGVRSHVSRFLHPERSEEVVFGLHSLDLLLRESLRSSRPFCVKTKGAPSKCTVQLSKESLELR